MHKKETHFIHSVVQSPHSSERKLNGVSDTEILAEWVKGSAGGDLWKDQSNEVQQSLLNDALEKVHQRHVELLSEAEKNGDSSSPETYFVIDFPFYPIHVELEGMNKGEEHVMTGVYGGVVLDTHDRGLIDVGGHILLDEFKDGRLDEYRADTMLKKSIIDLPTWGFHHYTCLAQDMESMIKRKSLSGFEGSAPSIIEALTDNHRILSERGCLKDIKHTDARAISLRLNDVEDTSTDHPGTSIALTLQILWWDCGPGEPQLPEFKVNLSRTDQGSFVMMGHDTKTANHDV